MSSIKVSIKSMPLSNGRTDYFVSIAVGDREVTPHVFREEYKAAYHVALYDWLLNGTSEKEPDCVEFGPDDWPARVIPAVVQSAQVSGFTFCKPDGSLDYRIVPTVVEAAQSNAAFACDRPYSYISLPADWERAYGQEFRIVPAILAAQASPVAPEVDVDGLEEIIADLRRDKLRMREALNAVDSEIVLTGQLKELVDAALTQPSPAATVETIPDDVRATEDMTLALNARQTAINESMATVETTYEIVQRVKEACAQVADRAALRCVREQIPGDGAAQFIAKGIRALIPEPVQRSAAGNEDGKAVQMLLAQLIVVEAEHPGNVRIIDQRIPAGVYDRSLAAANRLAAEPQTGAMTGLLKSIRPHMAALSVTDDDPEYKLILQRIDAALALTRPK